MKRLTMNDLVAEAARFSKRESEHDEPTLYGVTDGKAVGTYLEHKFVEVLYSKYDAMRGNSARGIDLPSVNVDIKVTSIKQPQSSCPFSSARQKIFGLGYSLLVFVYDKADDHAKKAARLKMLHTILVDEKTTADYMMTKLLREIVDHGGNAEEIAACMTDRNLPVDEIEANSIAQEVLKKKPEQGYLTISNALQWRLQYSRVVENAGRVDGVRKL